VTDDLLAPIALIARAFTPYDLPFGNFTTLMDVRPLPREIHDFPPLIEYWYVVIALSPVFAGAFNVSVKPPTSGDNFEIVGGPGIVFGTAVDALKVRVVV
jgi:hypothetical protein